jgi:outer membrane protein OmpA-like peptidoglycan-associated protein
MNRKIVSFAFVLLFAICSVAQDIPKEEIYGGYTFVRFNASAPVNAFTANGGVGSFQYNFNKWIGLAAELGGVHNGALSISSSGTLTPDQTAFTYLFGPRVFFNKAGVVSPFLEVLGGGVHNSRSFSVPNSLIPIGSTAPSGVTVTPGPTTTKFASTQNAAALAVGGGIDIRVSRLISFRPVQLDYLPTHFSPFNITNAPGNINSTKWQQNLRYSAGLSFRFGGAPPPPPKASCSVSPTEVLPWQGPVKASLQTADFNPKHPITTDWKGTGGSVNGDNTSATVDTTTLAPGSYTVTAVVTDPKEKKMNSASCSASFTVKQPQPPQVACSATPTTVHPGDPVNLSVQGSSPDGSSIKDRNFSASAGSVKEGETTAGGQPGQFSSTAVLDTSNAPPGPLNVTVNVTDVHGLSATCVATANVEALPAPVTIVSESLISDCEFKNAKKLARIDNECKAVLDEVALRLQHEPNGKLVVVGYAEEQEEVEVNNVESLRAYNAKSYLTGGEAKQQIDASRIEVRKSDARDTGAKAQFYFVPEGGTFTVKDTVIVDESSLPADKTGAPKKTKASKQQAAASTPPAE